MNSDFFVWCVVRQFEGYFTEPNIHHNGKLVLGESIGDLAGACAGAQLALPPSNAAPNSIARMYLIRSPVNLFSIRGVNAL